MLTGLIDLKSARNRNIISDSNAYQYYISGFAGYNRGTENVNNASFWPMYMRIRGNTFTPLPIVNKFNLYSKPSKNNLILREK